MAVNERRTWLIAYDIAAPKRLTRVQRFVKSVAAPAQYSLYVASETTQGILAIRDEIATRIDPREDDVRIYCLPKRSRIVHYGRGSLPEGLLLAESSPLDASWRILRA
jgi:CRISPR-associated protein Cas2